MFLCFLGFFLSRRFLSVRNLEFLSFLFFHLVDFLRCLDAKKAKEKWEELCFF